MMQTIGFLMQLHAGCEEEYRRRHAAIWPELKSLLHDAGIREYSIFLEERTLRLFAVLSIDDAEKLNSLATQPVMRRWWDHMEDIMDTNPDHSPVVVPLKQLFYLP